VKPLPQGTKTAVEQKAHVRGAEPGDLADLAIGHLVLKLQADHLLLVLRKSGQKGKDPVHALSCFERRRGKRVGALFLLRAALLHRPVARLFFPNVEGAVAAHLEEPGSEVPVETGRILGAQAKERILNHIARPL
jgi:hypothetical protein